jgi:multicomponent Na+:H+ antiporter subunit B
MNTVILQLASKYVRGLLIVFSVIMLVRGHNLPGGGFIGGLLAGLSIAYKGFAFTPGKVEAEMKIRPEYFMVFGLFLVFASLWPGLFVEGTLMQGVWFTLPFPFTQGYKVGTPFLFDIGVYFIVIGVTVLFLFSLTEKD